MLKVRNVVNVFLGGSSQTVEVTLGEWNNHDENGVGTLANGKEVTVFQSYDGNGFLVLSDQDTERLEREQGL